MNVCYITRSKHADGWTCIQDVQAGREVVYLALYGRALRVGADIHIRTLEAAFAIVHARALSQRDVPQSSSLHFQSGSLQYTKGGCVHDDFIRAFINLVKVTVSTLGPRHAVQSGSIHRPSLSHSPLLQTPPPSPSLSCHPPSP